MSSIRDGVMFTLLESITSLEDIWQEIGIKEDQKGERSNTVMRHIQGTWEIYLLSKLT